MDEFIWLEKDGEQIQVHPLSVPNHLELGWKVVEINAARPKEVPPVEKPVESIEEKPAAKKRK